MIKYVVHIVFVTYTLMLLARILLSWLPSLNQYKFAQFLIFYTEPYLKIFRKFIPPIGGVVDLSPMIGFFALRILEGILLRIL